MIKALFITDLHGRKHLYSSLFSYLRSNPPDVLLIGGDLLPAFISPSAPTQKGDEDFINGFMRKQFMELKAILGRKYPEILLIMGNDDPRVFESALIDAGRKKLWTYIHDRKVKIGKYTFSGYNYVPPTPYILKDWERYDVSRYTDIGCISPEEGKRSFPVSDNEKKWKTIKEDLDMLAEGTSMENAVFLFHTPPYKSALDLADLNNVTIEHVPVDPHIGSIAVQRFIEEKQPLITLHGHVHESSRLTGRWLQKIGRTICINGSSDESDFSFIQIDLEQPGDAERIIIRQ